MKKFRIILFLSIHYIVLISTQNNSDDSNPKPPSDGSNDTEISFDVMSVVTPHPSVEGSMPVPTTTEDYPQIFTPLMDLRNDYWLYFYENDTKESERIEKLVEKKKCFEDLKSNKSLENVEKSLRKIIKDILENKIQPKSKTTVFLAAYLFYPLFEFFWFFTEYIRKDYLMANKYLARYINVHLKTFSFVVFLLRIPFIGIYCGLVVGHRFLFLLLLGSVPTTLFPDDFTENHRKLFNVYYITLKCIGFLVGALGSIETYLRHKIQVLDTFS